MTAPTLLDRALALLAKLRGTALHPQWLSDRFHMRSRRELARIRNALVLDVGSGNSRHDSLSSLENTLVRLDYPETNKRYSALPDVYADGRALPVRGHAADVVLLLEVLEHLPDPASALQEAHRVLKPQGKLYISVPFLYPIHDAPHDYRRYTSYGMLHILRQHGFRPVQEFTHGNSLVTALQFINLALLEITRDAAQQSSLLGYILGATIYPVCLLVNLLAAPFLGLRRPTAACFGYFFVAERA